MVNGTGLPFQQELVDEVIGARGKVIKKIVEESGCEIDTEDDGTIYIKGIYFRGCQSE